MRKSRFSEEQMVKILREADRLPVADVAKKHKVSEQTIYQWRKRFGAMSADDAKALKALQGENAKLKKLLAERDLEIEVMKEIATKMVSAPARRQQVEYARRRGLSCRRACALVQVARSALGYVSRRAERDAPVLARMREVAAQYPRYGYRFVRIFVRIFLERDGITMSNDRAYRLWRVGGLQVPKKRPRRRVATGRPKPQAPDGPNQVWAYDFVFDACANGHQLKCLTVVDEWTRECLAIDVGRSIRSGRVIELLSRLVSVHGAPRFIRSDNGPEFVARAVLRWLRDEGIDTAYIDPGKPWQNGTNESFNATFRNECLGMEWFRHRAEAEVVIETWRRHYNEVRPHSSLRYLTPIQFRNTTHQDNPAAEVAVLQ